MDPRGGLARGGGDVCGGESGMKFNACTLCVWGVERDGNEGEDSNEVG